MCVDRAVSFCAGLPWGGRGTSDRVSWEHSREGELSGLLAMFLLMQPRIQLAFWAASARCRLMSSYSSTKSFSSGLLLIPSSPACQTFWGCIHSVPLSMSFMKVWNSIGPVWTLEGHHSRLVSIYIELLTVILWMRSSSQFLIHLTVHPSKWQECCGTLYQRLYRSLGRWHP